MSIQVRLLDARGGGLEAHVHELPGPGKHAGVLTLTERFLQFDPDVRPFLNDSFGNAMNRSVTFGGTPEGIHDGTDSALWTGAAISGTWDFSDTTNPSAGSNCVSLTSGDNGDTATFSDATETVMSGFETMTGLIRLDTYSGVNNSISLQFLNNAVNVGNSINLNDYINTATLNAYQSFAIPKADFGIDAQTVDQINMTLLRTGGAKPTFRVDTWQIEDTGAPLTYLSSAPAGARYHIDRIRVTMVDALAATLTDGTMPALAYDKLLGVSALTNGLAFRRVQKGKIEQAFTLRQLSDFLSLGAHVVAAFGDGTNTLLTLEFPFREHIVLEGEPDSFLSITVSDDLSGLLLLHAVSGGAIEV